MKVKMMIVVLSLMCLTQHVFAATGLPQRLPIDSLESMWIHAVSQVRNGTIVAYSRDILYNDDSATVRNFNYTPGPFGADPREIENLIKNQTLSFEVSRVDRAVQIAINLQDGETPTRGSRVLFQGGIVSKISPNTDGTYSISTRVVRLRIADVLYISYPNAYSAYYQEEDAQGNLIKNHFLTVEDGELHFPVGLITNARWLGEKQAYTHDKYGSVIVNVKGEDDRYFQVAYNVRDSHIAPLNLVTGSATSVVQIGQVINYRTDTANVMFGVSENLSKFVGCLRYSEETFVTIYPSQGVKDDVNAYPKHVTACTGGMLINGVTLEIIAENFETSAKEPFGITLPPGIYYLILNNWDDPLFGGKYWEEHNIDYGGGKGGGTAGGESGAY